MLSSTNQPRKMLEDEVKCKFRGQMDVHGSCCFTSPIAHAKSGTKMVDEVPGTLPLRVGGQSEQTRRCPSNPGTSINGRCIRLTSLGAACGSNNRQIGQHAKCKCTFHETHIGYMQCLGCQCIQEDKNTERHEVEPHIWHLLHRV